MMWHQKVTSAGGREAGAGAQPPGAGAAVPPGARTTVRRRVGTTPGGVTPAQAAVTKPGIPDLADLSQWSQSVNFTESTFRE